MKFTTKYRNSYFRAQYKLIRGVNLQSVGVFLKGLRCESLADKSNRI